MKNDVKAAMMEQNDLNESCDTIIIIIISVTCHIKSGCTG